MANKEHLAVLRQGVEAWNQWRKDPFNQEIKPDLSSADLEGADLTFADLSDANLSDADFRSAKLSGADLEGADLTFADLSDANLSDADFKGARLSDATLSSANLSGADLSDVDLTFADLRDADLSDADFRSAKLSGADLEGADFSNANLSNANLSNANLKGVNLEDFNLSNLNLGGIDLSGADLSGADLSGANLSSADLEGADLSGANLEGADLEGAYLSAADLRRANLSGASLSSAKLSNAKLRGADLRDADLEGADLSGADLREANLRGAIIDGSTTLDPKWRLVHALITQGGQSQILIFEDLSYAEISEANLRGADLKEANLKGSNLSDAYLINADLSRTDLSNANLVRVQALGADFERATLTGACIEDWNINAATNLNHVICEYVFLKRNQQERRPSDPNKTFAPGEFTKLFQKALETVDLIFADGIDWKAFFQSFQELQAQYADEEVSIQAIEKKSGGAFVIRLEVPAEIDKAAIERDAMQKYEANLQILEAKYRAEIQAKDKEIESYKRESANMMEITRLLASRPINVEARAVAEQQSGDTYSGTIKATNFAPHGIASGGIFNDFSNAQDLTEAAAQIQSLLTQLQQQGETSESAQQKVAQDLAEQAKKDPTTLGKLVMWGQKLGDATVTDVVKGVVKLALRSAGVPLP